jgi:hypothetical protein
MEDESLERINMEIMLRLQEIGVAATQPCVGGIA